MASEVETEEVDQTFAEAVLGKQLFEEKWLKRFMGYSPTVRIVVPAALFAALLFIPYLGAVGLWDPWETHYGEVARQMIQRNDYVHPYWESAWFFSKPVLTMWITALGMQIVGTNRTTLDEPLALYTEWGMRLPFALMSIAALALLGLALSRTVNRRTGLAAVFVLATMPLYFLITRQAVTDTPFITTTIAAMACAIIGQFDQTTRHRAAWWYAFYILMALAGLAKEIIPGLIPAAVLLVYAILSVIPWNAESWNAHVRWVVDADYRVKIRAGGPQAPAMPVLWAQCYRMKLGTGFLIFCLVGVPWLVVMCLFDGVDDEGKVFWFRYFVHDQLNRLTAGVHTTTPGGTFTYFIEQGGFAIFPWVALVPGAMGVVSRLRVRGGEVRDHVGVLAAVWAFLTFVVIGSSATKFHHYVLPMLPGVAILIAFHIDKLWEQGIAKHWGALMFGLALFILVGKDLSENPKNFTDLFVYNYDRPYPVDLVQRPLSLFAGRPLYSGDLITVVLLALGGYLSYEAFTDKQKPIFSRAVALAMGLCGVALLVTLFQQGKVSPSLVLGMALAGVALYVFLSAGSVAPESRNSVIFGAAGLGVLAILLFAIGVRLANAAQDPLLSTLVQPVNIKSGMGFAFAIGGLVCAVAALLSARTMLFGSFWALAFGFALWFNWSHWVDLSHHWTQRDQYWVYYKNRRVDEPVTAFLMNWRGETFYSKNTVKQIKENPRFSAYAALPGRKWSQVEHNRFGILKGASGPDKTVNIVDKDLNNKFMLVTIE